MSLSVQQRQSLEALRHRLEKARSVLNSFLHPKELSWPDMVAKYNLLSSLYAQLMDELQNAPSSLRDALLVPQRITQPAVQSNLIPNVYLRTKLLPEMEQSQSEWLQLMQEAPPGPNDEAKWQKLNAWCDLHDKRISRLSQYLQNMKSEFDLKLRPTLDDETDEEVENEDEMMQDKPTLVPPLQADVYVEELHNVLSFISCGKYINS